jgi:hypothetical protein
VRLISSLTATSPTNTSLDTFLQNVFVFRSLRLTRNSALVRFVSCVGSDVLLKVGELGELALTDLAPVGLDAQVEGLL